MVLSAMTILGVLFIFIIVGVIAIKKKQGYGQLGGIKLANTKTNAMRILDREEINYNQYSYDYSDGMIDGITVAGRIGKSPEEVYKTLVAQGVSGEYYVFIIPVDEELNLKAAAKSVKEKSIHMIKVSDITKVTGYVRGGCSPLGMKKSYKTILDKLAEELDMIIVSAGKIGYQIQLDPKDLIKITNGEFHNII